MQNIKDGVLAIFIMLGFFLGLGIFGMVMKVGALAMWLGAAYILGEIVRHV